MPKQKKDSSTDSVAKIKHKAPTKERILTMKMFLDKLENIGNFNITRACQICTIDRGMPDLWRKKYPWFDRRMRVINEMKKDLFEDGLIRRVQDGSDIAAIFSAKAMLKDRGYEEKRTIEIKDTVGISKEQKDKMIDQHIRKTKRRQKGGYLQTGLKAVK